MEKTVFSTMLILFLWTSSFVLLVSARGRCPDTWTVFGQSCYKFIPQRTSWFDAREICTLAAGHMVTIESPEEQQFVGNMALKYELYVCAGVNVWIGLSDLLEEGHFVWSDTQLKPTYTNWVAGEPNDVSRVQNCVRLWYEHGSRWDDYGCEYQLPTICEKTVSCCLPGVTNSASNRSARRCR